MSKKEITGRVITWTIIAVVVTSLGFVIFRAIDKTETKVSKIIEIKHVAGTHANIDSLAHDAEKIGRSLRILKRAFKTGYIDTTGYSNAVIDTNRY